MKKVALLMTYLYFLICPLEFILNRYFGSSVKYIAIVAAAFMLMFFIGSRRAPMRFGTIQVCIILWTLLESASYLWTIHSSKTLSMLITYAMMAVLVFAISIFPIDKKEFDRCFMAYMIGCLLLSIFLLIAGVKHEGRLTICVKGAYQDPNGLSAILLSGVFFSAHRALQKPARTIIPNIIYGLCFLIMSVAIFATSSRGALVAFTLAFLVYVIVATPKNQRWKILIIIPFVLTLIYLVMVLTLPASTLERLFDLDAYEGGGGRIRIWSQVLQMIMESPLFGYGILSHQGYFYEKFGHALSMHNTFLFVLFEVGAVGLSLFLVPYLKTFLFSVKNKNAMICAIIAANFAAAFFLDALNHRYLWNALMFAVMYYNSSRYTEALEN